jgi:hypothetical protein
MGRAPLNSHCRGCNRFRPVTLLKYGPLEARRCQACYRNSARAETLPKLPTYWECDECEELTCCLPDNTGAEERLLCMTACWRIAQLAAGRVTTHTTAESGTLAQAKDLTDLHHRRRQSKHVDMWVMPTTPYCQYVLFRIIVWCRFGLLVGMVPAAPAATWRRNHHTGERSLDVGAMVAHLTSLRDGGRWPGGGAPIIIADVRDQDLTYSIVNLQKKVNNSCALLNFVHTKK